MTICTGLTAAAKPAGIANRRSSVLASAAMVTQVIASRPHWLSTGHSGRRTEYGHVGGQEQQIEGGDLSLLGTARGKTQVFLRIVDQQAGIAPTEHQHRGRRQANRERANEN